MSDTIVVDLAGRYGVKVKWVPSGEVPRRYEGPMGQGCNPKKRLVYFEEGNDWAEIEHYFHELVHVIVQPPWWTINEVPEEFILFQFERALALETMDAWAVEQVIAWQHETAVHIKGHYVGAACLGDLKPYEQSEFWKAGYKFCRILGLLDERNRPTFKRPRWERLAPYAAEILRYYETQEQSPLPTIPAGVIRQDE